MAALMHQRWGTDASDTRDVWVFEWFCRPARSAIYLSQPICQSSSLCVEQRGERARQAGIFRRSMSQQQQWGGLTIDDTWFSTFALVNRIWDAHFVFLSLSLSLSQFQFFALGWLVVSVFFAILQDLKILRSAIICIWVHLWWCCRAFVKKRNVKNYWCVSWFA